ncbi:hypothetical protein [Streptomyces sp. NPDC087856]|uniref:hypothetical protein n=1 Tax=Streptomyces sp. NPDC087856 TaxID=3365811 RepID=UPI0037FCFD76
MTSSPGVRGGPPERLDAVPRRFRALRADPGPEADVDFLACGCRPVPATRLVTELRAGFPGTVGPRATTVLDHPTPRRLAQWLSAAQTRPRPMPTPFPPASRKD